MERRSRPSGNTRLSSVVRQFTPSRIELQLLAQVFEIVVSVRCPLLLAAADSVPDRHSNVESQGTDGKPLHGRPRSAA
jgi:hypothetical protein